jgi:uncharacterized repeat protein (TIGR01451 family)
MAPKPPLSASSLTQSNRFNRTVRPRPVASFVRIGAFLILAGLLGSSLYLDATLSVRKVSAANQKIGTAIDESTRSNSYTKAGATRLALPPMARYGAFLTAPPPPAPVTISTYAGDCSSPKTIFNLQDADKKVCAKVTGALPYWHLIWSNARFVAVQDNVIGSDTDFTFTLSPSSSLGDWRVILFDPFGGTVQVVSSFTVIDASNPVADLSLDKGPATSAAAAGGQVVYALQVSNNGPSAATNVQLTDDVPANTTFVSLTQLTGPVFTCSNPEAGATGTSTCTIERLDKGGTATFLAAYLVDGGTSAGTELSNTANIASVATQTTAATADPNSDNNTATAIVRVAAAAPCVLTPPSNIDVNADPNQAGAIVNYPDPSSTGDCGQSVVDEGGETVPPISCSPASGSFFPVGTTTVICSAQTGSVAIFQVTVENPGGLSITLNGADPLSVECGTGFNDPGATAIDSSGNSVPVTVSLPNGFDPTSPDNGSYVLTYTATQGSNSVSKTRTVNVADTTPPQITIAGANPFKIEQGTCLPFVDPGVSANDSCAGSVPVSSSISGPGGKTAVDPNTAGTYTITYTATDGSHSSTATRTVIVGNFPPDEQDLGTSTAPPVVKLIGGDSETNTITAECGAFVDPGATATTACGGPLSYTVSGTVDSHTPGTYSLTYTATDGSLSTSVTRAVVITADNTAPTITLNGASALTVECHVSFTDPGATAHDACAGDFAATASSTVDINTPGSYTITYTASDPSGHAAAPVTRTVTVVDTTKPVISGVADVSVTTGAGATSCSAVVSDAQLGTITASDSCGGPLSVARSGVPAGNVFPVGSTTVIYTATDPSGNVATKTQTVTVADNTPPTISVPADIVVSLPLNSMATTVPVSYNVTAADNCTLASLNVSPASGSSFSTGVTTVTATATDAAGNVTTSTFKVTVLYNFTGFFQPMANLPTVNAVKAGQAVPVKFSLSGNKGLNIFALNSPSSGQYTCSDTDPTSDITQTLDATSNSINYDASSDQYNFVWKTSSSWAGTCRQLLVTLNDGSVHRANFKFK